jgi:hypothetical protein
VSLVLHRVFKLKNSHFLSDDDDDNNNNKNDGTGLFYNEDFIQKVAYSVDIFEN